jgi:hypothetical protein
VIRSLFETSQHEDRILHLLYTESSDTKYFTLVRHDISQEHDVTRIDRHSVGRHGMLNFVVNGLSSSFNTQDLACLHDVIRSGLDTVDTCDGLAYVVNEKSIKTYHLYP